MPGADLPDLTAEVSSVILNVGIASLPAEDTVPEAARWWTRKTRQYAEWGRVEQGWSRTVQDNTVRCLRVFPDRFVAAGLKRPVHSNDVTAELVVAWRENPMGPGHYHRKPGRLAQTTVNRALPILGGFMRFCRNPVGTRRVLWKVPQGVAKRRRWYDGPTLSRIWNGCVNDRERLTVALCQYAGVRRGGVFDLHVGDCSIPVGGATIVVRAKGGRLLELPVAGSVANALRPFIVGRAPGEKVYPGSYSQIARDLYAVALRIGLWEWATRDDGSRYRRALLSPHDLRRSFGRVLYYEHHVDINTIRMLYGHRDIAQTLYYIGASQDDLRTAVRSFDVPRPPALEPLPGGR